MFVEVHMLQSFGPSNLNRDDNNNPKECEFGGVRRARISSQCIKRAIRNSPAFAQATGVEVGTRTKWVVDLLRKRLVEAGRDPEQAAQVLTDFVPRFLSKLDKDGARTAVLLYLSQSELDRIARALLDGWQDLPAGADKIARALVKEHKGQTSAPDIALFGRMLAEYPELGLEAACQVAHAISTHRVAMEMDFYTAVDDLNPDDTAGAGMMGFVGFDSACFYRYARIDWRQLLGNLHGDATLAQLTVEGFLRASVAAVPTGKQSGFAANSPPGLLLAVVRRDGMGWSLVNAFERPIAASREGGYVGASAAALDVYWRRLCQVYGAGSLVRTAALALEPDLPLDSLSEHQVADLEAWVGAVVAALPAQEQGA